MQNFGKYIYIYIYTHTPIYAYMTHVHIFMYTWFVSISMYIWNHHDVVAYSIGLKIRPSNILKLQCLSVWQTGQGKGRAGRAYIFSYWSLFFWPLSSSSANSKQGRASRYLPGRYLLAAPIRNRAGQIVIFLTVIFSQRQFETGQGRPLSSWPLSSSSANSKQGRADRYLPGRYLLATPIRNKTGQETRQGRAGQLFSL